MTEHETFIGRKGAGKTAAPESNLRAFIRGVPLWWGARPIVWWDPFRRSRPHYLPSDADWEQMRRVLRGR